MPVDGNVKIGGLDFSPFPEIQMCETPSRIYIYLSAVYIIEELNNHVSYLIIITIITVFTSMATARYCK